MTEWVPFLLFLCVGLVLMLGYPVAFTLAGVSLVFAFIGGWLELFDPAFLEALPNRLYGIMTNETLIAVPLFVFMGVMLERSRVAESLLDTMAKLFGPLRGGLGISVTLVGMLLAASTGIVGATVVTMGLLSLPTMIRRNYDPGVAAGTICASGTLGQIIPPSIVLVLLGDVLSSAYQQAQLEMGIWNPETVSVGDLFVGALVPGLMLVALYMIYLLGVALVRPAAVPAIPAAERARGQSTLLLQVLKVLMPPLLLIVLVLGSILGGLATPTEAAGVGAVGALMLAGYRLSAQTSPPILAGVAGFAGLLALRWGFGTLSLVFEQPDQHRWLLLVAGLCALGLIWGLVVALVVVLRPLQPEGEPVLKAVMRQTTLVTSMVFVIFIGASLFSLVFRGFGGDEVVTGFLTDLPGGTASAVFLVMLVMFLLGFILDFIEITFVVVPIVGPILLAMGLDPVWLGVMIAINLQTSFLTPPFGFALFYLRGVAPPEVTTAQIYRGAVPFIVIQLLMLALLAWWPQLATWLPHVVYG
jgi:TRAP-type mannitol/chloroaromatic compound transport system permease large subunit